MVRRMVFGLICALVLPVDLLAQNTIFVVRHAERADAGPGAQATMTTDPDLSEAGHARAASLAAMLKDARIGAIFVTEYKRTQQTAAPLARVLGIVPTMVPAKDTAGLAARLTTISGHALVVGHSNTVPEVVTALGVATPVSVAETEFDNLFIVTSAPEPRVVQLRYR